MIRCHTVLLNWTCLKETEAAMNIKNVKSVFVFQAFILVSVSVIKRIVMRSFRSRTTYLFYRQPEYTRIYRAQKKKSMLFQLTGHRRLKTTQMQRLNIKTTLIQHFINQFQTSSFDDFVCTKFFSKLSI